MRAIHASARVALAVSLLTLILLSAGAASAGYLVEAREQSASRAQRLAAAAAYVEHNAQHAGSAGWQQSLARRLAALDLHAQLTVVAPDSKRAMYVSKALGPALARSGPADRTSDRDLSVSVVGRWPRARSLRVRPRSIPTAAIRARRRARGAARRRGAADVGRKPTGS